MPEIFDLMAEHDHEQVVFFHEPSCGYRGIIAIHDSALGPALGGTRFWNYASDAEAVVDVLRLARGMTFKAAVAGLNLGGGKSVIVGDNKVAQREMIMRAHGRAVESLGGRYITAEDVGTSVEDMDYIHMETGHVVGMAGKSGDPSPITAYGTYRGMKACALKKFGSDSLDGRTVVIQGAGHVGYFLAQDVREEGAHVFIADIDETKVQRCVDELGCEAIGTDEVYAAKADIFAPCALGAILNDDTIPALDVSIVAGAANNQLAEERHAKMLQERDIVYAPDYVINAGGLINVYSELAGWSLERSRRKAGEIYRTLLRIFEIAEESSVTTAAAADEVALERIGQVARLHRTYV
ncbi:MAG: Glu/Leu/Phe/Val dehydrogenase [Gemmatimonadota bacterium]|nr:Glu/Leu/Phe/Val dehydrogenase [Gemmatimonadota bacterium]